MVRAGLMFAYLLCLAAPVTAEESLWLGTIDTGVSKLRILLRLQVDAAGGKQVAFTSLDQTNTESIVEDLVWTATEVRFAIKQVKGTYAGKVTASGIEGTWTQGGPLALNFIRIEAPPTRRLKEIWTGELNAGVIKLPLLYRVFEDGDKLDALMTSPSQSPAEFATTVQLDATTITLETKLIGARFVGKLQAAGEEAQGTFTQSGQEFALMLKRNGQLPVAKRPQHPQPPFAYRALDVKFRNEPDNLELAGTLTLPEQAGKYPAVVLISGSGQQDRDETLMGHKPFLVIADYLTRQGYAVLRYDDRGVGGSEGDPALCTSEDFSRDAEAAVNFLLGHAEVDGAKIGLIGHSEGGLIGPMVAARRKEVAFVVLLAGPAIPGDQILLSQGRAMLQAVGAEEKFIKAREQAFQILITDLRTHAGSLTDEALAQATAVYANAELGAAAQPMTQELELLKTPWMASFLLYDPLPTLQSVKVPILALNGEQDLQVLPDLNLDAIRTGLTAVQHPDFEAVELPGLNHLFQTSVSGSPAEYSSLEETFSPVALKALSDWLDKRCK